MGALYDARMLHCPICGYDLRAAVNADGARCTECGRVYSRRDLEVLLQKPDTGGEPATLSTRERRLPGWLLILILVAMIGGVIWVLNVMYKRA